MKTINLIISIIIIFVVSSLLTIGTYYLIRLKPLTKHTKIEEKYYQYNSQASDTGYFRITIELSIDSQYVQYPYVLKNKKKVKL